ncbi:MAG: hypothetical protein AMXMBFR13_06100 [Phycisphaerae bacterium]
MSQALNNVDWDLLHQQKLVLLEMLNSIAHDSPAGQALFGIIHLLDALQDEAAEDGRWQFPEDTHT